jgi:hypothetical protein
MVINNSKIKKNNYFPNLCFCAVLSFCFLINTSTLLAQPVTAAPAVAVPSNDETENIKPSTESVQLDAKSAKQKNNVKKQSVKNESIANPWALLKAKAENEKGIKIKVNRDSIYAAFANSRLFYQNELVNFITIKIVPNTFLEKIVLTDPNLYKFITVRNKIFSTITVRNEVEAMEMKKNYQMLDELSTGFQLNTYQMFNEVLPAILISSQEMTVETYQSIIENYFKTIPELVYHCNVEFLKLLENKEYVLMYALHKESANKIKMITENNN